MLNPYNRKDVVSLNGEWNVIIDPFCRGEIVGFYKNKKPSGKADFVEYSFSNALRLHVPGDFNSQMPELKYYEGNVWYQRTIKLNILTDKKQFLYFAGANYFTKVWLNGKEIGFHEGGFSPFHFDITSIVKDGDNDLVVMVNNNRNKENIPAMNFDWWNYGGITRDVFLVQTPKSFIEDYKIQIKKSSATVLTGFVRLNGVQTAQNVEIKIPELKINKTLTTNDIGEVSFEINAKPQLWNPEIPKLYSVTFVFGNDTVTEDIGFRTIETKGSKVLLNGAPIFLKGVNFHEEISQRMGRAYSDADAAMILSEVKALGCNFIRTGHYPQNERIVSMAEKMGLMIWEEIPIWQGIDFTNEAVMKKAEIMFKDMIERDKNRAAIIIWSVANETSPSTDRNRVLIGLVKLARELDNTRLIGAAFNNITYDKATFTFTLQDSLIQSLDLIGVNKYMGWYMPFPVAPSQLKWNIANDKPLLFSEFGGEALYGQHGASDVASSWSEEYQEKLYLDNIEMFKNIPNLCGIAPWVLFDFRSPTRMNYLNQNGWNRKGLISDKGMRKKAWYVMKDYYNSKSLLPGFK
jgi:beta-glucuronidase